MVILMKFMVFMRMYSRCRAGSLHAVGAWMRRNGSFAVRSFFALMICAMLGWSGTALAAVTAHVDRFNISEDETVNLTIEVSGGDSGEPQTAPLLKDFEILSNSHSSSFSIVNGSTSSKSVWQLVLRPRHAGALRIPPLKVGSVTTRPIIIQVSQAQARTSSGAQPSGDVWLSMDISPKQLRVQQQAIITIRVYQAVSLNQAQLTKPKAEHAIIERLGDDASYQKRENNRIWQVIERHYALFPQQSGHIDIEPVQLDGSEMIGGASFFQTARPIRVRSNSLSLDVSAIPDSWSGEAWLPAKRISIEESWPQSHRPFRVGEPVTRTLTLRADGLTASQLPELPHDLPEHLKSYADKPLLKDIKRADGVHGSRQEKIAIMPMQPGTYILPEIDIAWWNTESGKMEQAVLPARTFTVIAGAAQPAPPVSKHVLPTPPQTEHHTVITPSPAGLVAGWWQWLALFFAAIWLLTLAYLWHLRRGGGARHQDERHREARDRRGVNLKQARTAVEAACKAHDAKACEQALLHLATVQYPDSLFHSLSALSAICSPSLRAAVLTLEQALYAPGSSPWQGDALLHAFRQGHGFIAPAADATDQPSALPGLYPE